MLPSLSPVLRDTPRGIAIEKLQHFLADHGMASIPVLALQCSQIAPMAVDATSNSVISALLNGTGRQGDGYWADFVSRHRAPRASFDGLRSGGDSIQQGWAAEIHGDGHVIAAVQAAPNPETAAVYLQLKYAFSDFGRLVIRLRQAAGLQGEVHLTASLLSCNGLPVLREHHWTTSERRLTRDHYAWPVEPAQDDASIEAACSRMGERFQRLF